MNPKMRLAVLWTALALTFPAPAADPADLVFTREYLAEVLRHLYRWHLDETALLALDGQRQIEFLTRRLRPPLDEGDESRYAEILLPALGYRVAVKKADYLVPELNLRVQNEDFKVQSVQRGVRRPLFGRGYRSVRYDFSELRDYLFQTRNQAVFPDDALRARLREAVWKHFDDLAPEEAAGPRLVYVAPLSPVSNDLWVFWENAHRLVRFSADADMTTPAYWAVEKVGVQVYDLRENVVVSLAEVSGSNAYVTRDWAARTLFNCVVFGERLLVNPEEEANQPPAAAAP